jgi:hypothetical protein
MTFSILKDSYMLTRFSPAKAKEIAELWIPLYFCISLRLPDLALEMITHNLIVLPIRD